MRAVEMTLLPSSAAMSQPARACERWVGSPWTAARPPVRIFSSSRSISIWLGGDFQGIGKDRIGLGQGLLPFAFLRHHRHLGVIGDVDAVLRLDLGVEEGRTRPVPNWKAGVRPAIVRARTVRSRARVGGSGR